MSKEAKIMISIAGLVVLGAVFLFAKGNKTYLPPADAGLLVRDNSDMSGQKNAKVTLVEFGDYQCPYCGQLHPIIKQLMETYKNNPNFNFVFRNFPLSQHQYAQLTAEAAEAAGAQGKFWEMHDLIYENQNQWIASGSTMDNLVSYAQSLGLNKDQFTSEVQNKKFQDKINLDLADGNALKVNSTPTLYLNGEQTNALDFTSLKSAIDEQLNK